MFEHPDVDASGLSHSRKRKVLTTVNYTTWKGQRYFLYAEAEKMFKDVEAKLPGYEVSFTSTNKAEDKYIVASFSDKTSGKRYIYDKATGKLDFLADISPWLPENELADMKPVSYKSRDLYAGSLRCSGESCWRVQPVHVYGDDSAVLEGISRNVA